MAIQRNMQFVTCVRPLLSWVALLISRPAWSTLSSKPLIAWKAAVAALQSNFRNSAEGSGRKFAGSILLPLRLHAWAGSRKNQICDSTEAAMPGSSFCAMHALWMTVGFPLLSTATHSTATGSAREVGYIFSPGWWIPW